MDESLRTAARQGNISDLYRLIQEDGNVLKRIEKVEFIDTPLHVAADEGCIDFAMELLTLKPTFARKLNQQGFSPIHLAVEKGHKELVLLLLENDKDLVRVKGKKGETPLHYAITREHKHDLIARFLKVCPECVRDVTTTNETALHIATRNNELEALKLLCGMLRRTDYREKVVNQKDRNGETALHIAARDNRHEVLHIYMDNISIEDRNALLVILGLLLTATYQAGLSPPGSVWQGDSSSNSIDNQRDKEKVGKSVMKEIDFLYFYIPSSAVFMVTFFLTLGLLKPFPRGFRTALQVLLAFLAICFYESIFHLAPTDLAAGVIDAFSVMVLVLMMFMCFAYRVSKVSVLILGCCLFRTSILFHSLIGNVNVGCWLFLFLYDEFWKGTALVVGYCFLIVVGSREFIIQPILILGCWLLLCLCRFCIKWCNEH
ncbi:uncharacterized protein LOC111279488 [Durio zibethinus]|uniref:Uncharacterized protein LOC111279488 n=1 Tax=Durio zibethinus TaxID=66656 RepID=A0A6P5X1C1_DURZI|nr:uncharacterized protein LOC111279488 [Durio zibethinus]